MAPVIGTHHSLSRACRQQHQERLAHRSCSFHHVDASAVRDAQACAFPRVVKSGINKSPSPILWPGHGLSETNCCPADLTTYVTTPGGVPSVKPVTVSRQTLRSSARRNSE